MLASLVILLSAVLLVVVRSQTPTQIHIALAGTDGNGLSNSMSVMWNTGNTQPKTSTVKYGTQSGVYTQTSTGSSYAYFESYNSKVVLGELAPATKYYYIVGDDAAGFSTEKFFTSAPTTAATRGNFSFVMFADLGVYNGDPTQGYMTKIKDDVSFVWHGGDVSYADDAFLHWKCYVSFCYESTIDEYLAKSENWASQLPYMVAPGNHEADCHDPNCLASSEKREKLSNFTAYNNRFRMPSVESGSAALNMHYSFNYGNAHFITLDTETGYEGAAEQYRYVLPCGGFADQLSWLEADLIKANEERAERPWIFAIGHHPMYQGNTINVEFQAAMENLFYKYGVDMYFSGHVHSYERDLPVYQGKPEADYINPTATTYVMIGGAGNDEMKDIKRRKQLAEQMETLRASTDPAPHDGAGGSTWVQGSDDGPWTAFTDKDNYVGIGKITIIDDSSLKLEYIRTVSGEVADSVTLTRDHSQFPLKM